MCMSSHERLPITGLVSVVLYLQYMGFQCICSAVDQSDKKLGNWTGNIYIPVALKSFFSVPFKIEIGSYWVLLS